MLLITAVGIPALNQETNIAKVIASCKKYVDMIIVCDDGSDDMTNIISKEMGAHVIIHKKNKGYGAALSSIFNEARQLKVDVLITIDSDGQHNPDYISSLISPIESGDADIVIGSRFLDKSVKYSKYRSVGIKAITKVVNTKYENITDSQSGMRAYNKNALSKIVTGEWGMSASTEILLKAKENNLLVTEVPITIKYEGKTSTQSSVVHGTDVFFNTLKIIAINRPILYFGLPGVIALCISIFFSYWSFSIFSETRAFTTNILLIAMGSLVVGILLTMLGIILWTLTTIIREK